jgi:hypothetical protein
MFRKLILTLALGLLAIPATALAKPNHQTASAKAHPTVQFVLRGTVSQYTAAAGAANGSIAFTVTSSNHKASALNGLALSFAVSSTTKVVLHEDAAITAGDHILVKVRALKGSSATDLQTHTASQVLDQG